MSDSPVKTTPPPMRRSETQLVSPIQPAAPLKKKPISISKHIYYTWLIHELEQKLEPLLQKPPKEDPETAHRRKMKILMSMLRRFPFFWVFLLPVFNVSNLFNCFFFFLLSFVVLLVNFLAGKKNQELYNLMTVVAKPSASNVIDMKLRGTTMV